MSAAATNGSSPYGMGLLPQHAAMLEASGISAEVAQARGYVSVDQRTRLERLGFEKHQQLVPGLLIPHFDVRGERTFHEYRPDKPRTNAKGKPVKYDRPVGVANSLDVHPAIRAQLGDQRVPLFVTEGTKKADAAVAAGLCCIGLAGVNGWRGTNSHGGRTALGDWEDVALNAGRKCYLCFDSDVTTKPAVAAALARLKAFLESRGARVFIIYLPEGPEGAKVGLDDYLAGHGPPELLALAVAELRTDDDQRLVKDLNLYEFIHEPEPEYQWVIPGIAEQGDRIILTGPEGGGKSTLLRQIAVQCGAGIHPFTLDPMPPLRTMLVDLENGRAHLRRQLRPLWRLGDGMNPELVRVVSRPEGINLLDSEHVDFLNERCDAHEPELVAIGPIYKMANGDPISEEIAKRVAFVLDQLRARHGCVLLIEAHQPYPSGGGKRVERPYGASLWSRWPEYGLHLAASGELTHWRGDRDERDWPKLLLRISGQCQGPWPWTAAQTVAVERADTKAWDGPTNCMEAIAHLLGQQPGSELSQRQLAASLRAIGESYRALTVSEAAERLAFAGRITVRTGPRRSRLFSALQERPDALI